ncbi:hypothetical protein Fmac_003367 [Flemingia macrophylla]|uniref:Uncharacterized protein n=1 Tax=Flemingia macrophylla TaxID=520843 RepID=A0ABD1NP21_9FABA
MAILALTSGFLYLPVLKAVLHRITSISWLEPMPVFLDSVHMLWRLYIAPIWVLKEALKLNFPMLASCKKCKLESVNFLLHYRNVRSLGAVGFVLISSFLIRESILPLITIKIHASLTFVLTASDVNSIPSMNVIYTQFGILNTTMHRYLLNSTTKDIIVREFKVKPAINFVRNHSKDHCHLLEDQFLIVDMETFGITLGQGTDGHPWSQAELMDLYSCALTSFGA